MVWHFSLSRLRTMRGKSWCYVWCLVLDREQLLNLYVYINLVCATAHRGQLVGLVMDLPRAFWQLNPGHWLGSRRLHCILWQWGGLRTCWQGYVCESFAAWLEESRHQLNCLSQDEQCLPGLSSLRLGVGFSGKFSSWAHPGPRSEVLCGQGGGQAALCVSVTDRLRSLPGAPRALPLRPVLNGCQQEEKLTKDRRPDFGGRGQGVPLDYRPRRTDPWLRPPSIPQSRKKRKRD